MAKNKGFQRRMVRIVAVVLAALMIGGAVFSALISAYAEEKPANPKNAYDVTLVYLEDAQAFSVHAEVKYHNVTGRQMDYVLFQLPANVFRRESALPYESDALEETFPAGYAPGGAEFSQVQFNGQSADWGVQGEYENYVRVGCDLPDDETGTFAFDYHLLMTQNRAFLGVSDEDVRVTGFYPSAAVWQYDTFQVHQPSEIGRTLYAESSDFTLRVTAPAAYTPAAGAVYSRTENPDGTCTWEWSIAGAREAGFGLSRGYRAVTGESEAGTRVAIYGSERSGCARALQYAVEALDVFERVIGAFPLESVSFAAADYGYESLETSGLVFLQSALFDKKNEEDLRYRVVRGIAMQYFGMAVGSDPVLEAWISETVPEYLYYVFIRETQGYDRYIALLNSCAVPSVRLTVPGSLRPDSYMTNFSSRSDFELVVRDRGVICFHEISLSLGYEGFLAGISRFYQENNGCITSVQDFVAACDSATGGDWGGVIVDWFYSVSDYVEQGIDWYE